MSTPKSKLNSSRTFSLRNPPPPSSMEAPKKRAPAIEFPTSPQLILGEEIVHLDHQQHPLSKINLPDLFTCSGCKEYGAGKRFSCYQCDFQLHEFCGSVPDGRQVLKDHPFHYQHTLTFHPKPAKGGITKSKCGACGKAIKGYRFRCNACAFRMHPSCGMLPDELIFSAHSHALKLLPLQWGDTEEFMCGSCQRRRSGRVYRCTMCEYHLHVVCAKSIVNGLHDNDIKSAGEKPSGMLGAVKRLASQVMIDFIGGFIEGLGESVGEVFVQSIARGRCLSRKSRAEGNQKNKENKI